MIPSREWRASPHCCQLPLCTFAVERHARESRFSWRSLLATEMMNDAANSRKSPHALCFLPFSKGGLKGDLCRQLSFTFEANNVIRNHRLGKTLEGQLADRLGLDSLLDRAVDPLGDQDLASLGLTDPRYR